MIHTTGKYALCPHTPRIVFVGDYSDRYYSYVVLPAPKGEQHANQIQRG